MKKVKDLINEDYQKIVLMKKTSPRCWTGHKTNLSKEEILEKYKDEKAEIVETEDVIGYDAFNRAIIRYEIKLFIYLEV